MTAAKAAEYFSIVEEAGKICDGSQPIPKGQEKDRCLALESITDFNLCDEASTKGLYYYWAPSDMMKDGESVVRTLLERARSGVVFNTNRVIVKASESESTEEHFALCFVSNINGVFGPPESCTTIAIVTPGKTWLRGGNRSQSFCYMSAEFRQNGAIDISFKVSTSLAAKQFSTSILGLLQKKLNLQAEEKIHDKDGNYISISSVSGLRVSQVLGGGWRESVGFDFSIDKEDAGKIDVHGTANVAVCRQALGNLTSYQGLDDAQRSTYAIKLDAMVGDAIRATCKTAQQRDARTILCQ